RTRPRTARGRRCTRPLARPIPRGRACGGRGPGGCSCSPGSTESLPYRSHACQVPSLSRYQIIAFIFVCTSVCRDRGASSGSAAHYGDEADAVARCAAQVLRQRQPAMRGGELAGTGLAAQLEPAFVDHPEPAGPDRVAEALEPAV